MLLAGNSLCKENLAPTKSPLNIESPRPLPEQQSFQESMISPRFLSCVLIDPLSKPACCSASSTSEVNLEFREMIASEVSTHSLGMSFEI